MFHIKVHQEFQKKLNKDIILSERRIPHFSK